MRGTNFNARARGAVVVSYSDLRDARKARTEAAAKFGFTCYHCVPPFLAVENGPRRGWDEGKLLVTVEGRQTRTDQQLSDTFKNVGDIKSVCVVDPRFPQTRVVEYYDVRAAKAGTCHVKHIRPVCILLFCTYACDG